MQAKEILFRHLAFGLKESLRSLQAADVARRQGGEFARRVIAGVEGCVASVGFFDRPTALADLIQERVPSHHSLGLLLGKLVELLRCPHRDVGTAMTLVRRTRTDAIHAALGEIGESKVMAEPDRYRETINRFLVGRGHPPLDRDLEMGLGTYFRPVRALLGDPIFWN